MSHFPSLDFNAKVFHALRTPLTVIREGIELVLDGTLGAVNAEQKESLDAAKMNVDRLARLINHVMEYQKLESGRAVLKPSGNDINQLIEAQSKGIGVQLKLGQNLPKIDFDKQKIAQVLNTLIKNAVKFTAKGSPTVQSERKDRFVCVRVQDEGPGIPAEDLNRVFEPLNPGLGLAIAKKIIEAHGGEMAVESVVGKGCTFYFTLPLGK